ncbi:hypothetical protein Q5P01_000088 [Channa striata]|uniref:non-specific serine/threonine protein kinase n=1 Tax=Channa striata TaxID=64152 RepID=A0AA88LMT5_CHASR|nr:hypothetical protein Q5P01_000088 [Channa striata]
MDMMEFMDLVYDGEKLSAMVEHGMAPTAVLRAQIHGLVVLEQLKRCGLPQYFHNFHVAGVTIGEFMTLGREENGWLLQRLVPDAKDAAVLSRHLQQRQGFVGGILCDGKDVAVKITDHKRCRLSMRQGTQVPTEIVMLDRIESPSFDGVVRLLDYYREGDCWFIVMEKPRVSQDLFDYVTDKGRLSEDTARNFLRQILEAVRHCHSRGVIHMDLKEENILVDLDTEKLKLIDFGSAHPIGDDVHSEFYGTKAYGPPERISSRGLFRARPAEVWSLGILLYSMVHGNVPFEENSEIVRGRLRFKTGLSDTCRDLILRCLRQNPDERPSVEQIFSHPWVTETKVSDTAVARDNKVTAASSSPEDLGELGVHGEGPGEGDEGRDEGRIGRSSAF